MLNKEKPSLISVDASVQEVNISEYNVNVVNSIKYKYPSLRQKSKIP